MPGPPRPVLLHRCWHLLRWLIVRRSCLPVPRGSLLPRGPGRDRSCWRSVPWAGRGGRDHPIRPPCPCARCRGPAMPASGKSSFPCNIQFNQKATLLQGLPECTIRVSLVRQHSRHARGTPPQVRKRVLRTIALGRTTAVHYQIDSFPPLDSPPSSST